MKNLVRILLVLSLLSSLFFQAARGAEPTVAYTVTYFEVDAAHQDQAAALGKALSSASAKQAGNLRFEVLQRIHQPGQFAILEAWSDKDAQAAHVNAAATVEFRQKLAPFLSAAYDERPHTALGVGPVLTPDASKPGAIFAITHVDIIPTEKDIGVGATKDMSVLGRSQAGNIRYEALTQDSRPNHMTLIEVWSNSDSIETDASQAYKKQYRAKLMPMSGSLYDERFYRLIG